MGRLQSLPPELLQSVVENLPISAQLGCLARLCRSMNYVISGYAFAMRHAGRQMTMLLNSSEMDLYDVWELCEAEKLPLSYRAALFAWLVHNNAFAVDADLLVAATPPHMSEDAALRVVHCFETMPMLYRLPLRHPALLNWAAFHGFTRVAEHLLAQPRPTSIALSSNSNDATSISALDTSTDPLNTTMVALKWASENGHAGVLELLLRHGDMDPCWNNSFVLVSSACEGHEACVRLLLLDGRAEPTNYALNRAAENGHANVVRLLLKDTRLLLEQTDNAPLKWSCENGHTLVVQLLLEDGRIDPGNRNNFNIKRAAREGHAEVVALLLADDRVDPTAEDQYAIKWSAGNGHVEVVKLLLADPRIDKHAEDDCALKWAIQNNHTEIMHLLQGP
ncbi:hypothetical protein HDU78_002287 [Chytriomyces hyalinus]|nr:hypothetical protein HDU78_002287 [Chytriomyces hyalinus]KAJ3404159.1 hypothetical protein HDU80_003206 [Chytriomyces hyalinus]